MFVSLFVCNGHGRLDSETVRNGDCKSMLKKYSLAVNKMILIKKTGPLLTIIWGPLIRQIYNFSIGTMSDTVLAT